MVFAVSTSSWIRTSENGPSPIKMNASNVQSLSLDAPGCILALFEDSNPVKSRLNSGRHGWHYGECVTIHPLQVFLPELD